jgi:hypothetical protein
MDGAYSYILQSFWQMYIIWNSFPYHEMLPIASVVLKMEGW